MLIVSTSNDCTRRLAHHEHSSACQVATYALLWHAAADSINACFEIALEAEGELRIWSLSFHWHVVDNA
jgi:hypothetical protein